MAKIELELHPDEVELSVREVCGPHPEGKDLVSSHKHKEILSTSRRTRPFIYCDILLAIRELKAQKGEARITPVQSLVNIPTKRFRRFLQDMEKSGLVQLNPLIVTDLGRQYTDEFEHFLKFLEKFGLAPRESLVRSSHRTPPKPSWAEIIAEYEGKLKTAI